MTHFNVRVKLDEGYARPRWYTVADRMQLDEARSYVNEYLANVVELGDPDSVLVIEIVKN